MPLLRGSRRPTRPPGGDWLAGTLLGLLSSTYSSLVVSLGARFIGRDALVDWMGLSTIAVGGRAVKRRPGPLGVAAGLAIHQGADIAWAALWGRMSRRVRRERYQHVTAAALLPWSLATAAVEYWLVLPWLQPLVRMEVPYWTAATVHLSSGAAYPLLPEVRARVTGRPEPGQEAARRAAVALTAALGALAALRLLHHVGREPAWPAVDAQRREQDRRFLVEMHAHHEVGLRLAELAAERAVSDDLQLLGRLMAAEHDAQLRLMRTWWTSFYGGDLPRMAEQHKRAMPTVPARDAVDALAELTGEDFDRTFLAQMLPHHEGAVRMADEEIGGGGDPRLRLLALTIGHTQRGQRVRMAKALDR